MHNVEYRTYPEDVNKQKVQNDLDHYVSMEDWQEGCGGLYHHIRWLGDKVYANRDEAESIIEQLDRGDYDNLAVKYYAAVPFTDAKLKELEKKVRESGEEYAQREKVLYAQTVTAGFISCKSCGSKLNRTKLCTNRCPVCKVDLRPDHMLKSVAVAKNRWEKAQENLKAYRDKKSKKKVCWLLKFEYHT